jgi:hypothetical protein
LSASFRLKLDIANLTASNAAWPPIVRGELMAGAPSVRACAKVASISASVNVPSYSFAGLGSFSAMANTTMETFNQRGAQVGGMNCHNRARMTADFMWTVVDHAYPSRLAPAGTATAGTR